MARFYFTMTADQAERNGLRACVGYVEVEATDASDARQKMWNEYEGVWAFQYAELESVHPADRTRLATIGCPEVIG